MKSRSPRNIERSLLSKGFEKISARRKSHHSFYYLIDNGKRTGIYTYLSHGSNHDTYGAGLMNQIKRQLKFSDSKTAEAFLDCAFTHEQYREMLKRNGHL